MIMAVPERCAGVPRRCVQPPPPPFRVKKAYCKPLGDTCSTFTGAVCSYNATLPSSARRLQSGLGHWPRAGDVIGQPMFWGGLACGLWCTVLVCSGRRPLADCHSLPFPWDPLPPSAAVPIGLSPLLPFPFPWSGGGGGGRATKPTDQRRDCRGWG